MKAAAILLLGLLGHPDSQSRSDLSIEGSRLSANLRFQAESLLEALPELDASNDGLLTHAELAAGHDSLSTLFQAGIGVSVGEERLLLRLTKAEVLPPVPLSPRQWLGATLEGEAARDIEALLWRSDLFYETSPGHFETLLVRWKDALPEAFELSTERRTAAARRGPSLRKSQALAGLKAGLQSAAPLALALLLAGRRRKERPIFFASLALGLLLERTGFLSGRVEARTLGLASATLLVYIASEVCFAKDHKDRPLAAACLGLLTPLALGVHPERITALLDPSRARDWFDGGGVLSLLTCGLVGAHFVRRAPRAIGGLGLLLGLAWTLLRARGDLPPGP